MSNNDFLQKPIIKSFKDNSEQKHQEQMKFETLTTFSTLKG